jgi:hypothetical protein
MADSLPNSPTTGIFTAVIKNIVINFRESCVGSPAAPGNAHKTQSVFIGMLISIDTKLDTMDAVPLHLK